MMLARIIAWVVVVLLMILGGAALGAFLYVINVFDITHTTLLGVPSPWHDELRHHLVYIIFGGIMGYHIYRLRRK